MRMRLIAVAAACVLMGGAAHAEDAPITTKSGTLGTAPAGKGQIVFFRPGSLMGAALGCTVREGETELARLGSGKYYVVTAEPGKHDYSTRGESSDKLTLEVEDGETYFVKCKIGMGVMSGSANISPSDRATFAGKAKGLTMWKGRDEDDAKK